jgi:hypothetical protein
MSKDLMNPAELLKQQLADTNERISTGDSIRIRLDKGVFHTPDGEKGEELSVVIIDFAMANAYYDRKYNANDPKPPACFAVATKKSDLQPVDNSPVPQNEDCKTCPLNEWKSAGGGSNAKACKNTRVLAVVPISDIAKSDIWLLSVPPSSITLYDKFVKDLSINEQLTPLFVHTSVKQDPDIDWSAPRFSAVGSLTKKDVSEAISRIEEARKLVLQTPDFSEYEAP